MTLEKWLIRAGETRVIDIEIVRSLKIGLLGGSIDIIAHDEPGARVEVNAVTGRDLKISVVGDRLEIDHPQIAWDNVLGVFSSARPGGASAQISLLVPRHAALTLGTVGADALVSGLTASVKASTVSGELQLDGVTGNAELNTVSGEVTIREHTGAINAHAVTADITAEGAINRFSSDSVSGNVFLDARGQLDRVSTNTVSGNVTARVDPEYGARYVANTVSGALNIDGRRISGTRGRGFSETTSGSSGFYIDVKANSVSGDITVFRRVATATPAGAAGPAQPAGAEQASETGE